jgi:dihydrofolate reductase
MIISMIAAMDRHRVIGKDNDLPWKLPRDMKHFVATTKGKPIVMGRKTYESIGKPLPGRKTIVLTRDPHYVAEGCVVVQTKEAAMAAAGDVAELVVGGGAGIYQLFLPHAHRLYLTYIDAQVDGDTHFPEIDPDQWHTTSRETHLPDERNAFAMTFVQLDRQQVGFLLALN